MAGFSKRREIEMSVRALWLCLLLATSPRRRRRGGENAALDVRLLRDQRRLRDRRGISPPPPTPVRRSPFFCTCTARIAAPGRPWFPSWSRPASRCWRSISGPTASPSSAAARGWTWRAIPRTEFGELVRDGVRDVEAAVRYLARQGLATDRIVLIGASYGCSVSLLSAEQVEGVRALVLLSPGTNYFGVDVLAAASELPGPAPGRRSGGRSPRRRERADHRQTPPGSRRPRDLPLRRTRDPPVRPAAGAEEANRRVRGEGRRAGGRPAVKKVLFPGGSGTRVIRRTPLC